MNNDYEYWAGKHYAFFSNQKCEFFPCHSGMDPDSFNCLFCYCPLYLLGNQCGGNFTYTCLGVKDCSGCTVPHRPENYGYITRRLEEAAYHLQPCSMKGNTNQIKK